MFPRGAPGAGLILLRLCAVGAGVGYVVSAGETMASWGFLALLPIAFLLLVGLLTPFACVGALTVEGISVVQASFRGLPCCLLGVPLLVAVLLLGPGAYSFDAKRFGRRKMAV